MGIDLTLMSEAFSTKIERVVEQTIIDGYIAFQHLPEAELSQGRYALLLKTGRLDTLLNGVFKSHFPRQQVEKIVISYLEFFQSKALPFTWLVTPSSRPTGLEKVLERNGLVCEDHSSGMALDLKEWNAQAHSCPVSGLVIRQVHTPADRHLWFRSLQAGFNDSGVFVDALRQLYDYLDIHETGRNFHFLGEIDGQAAATCTLSIADGVGSIFDVSTLPEFRKRGIGSAMTSHALAFAQQMGEHLAVLEASAMGNSVYQAVGFSEIGLYLHYN